MLRWQRPKDWEHRACPAPSVKESMPCPPGLPGTAALPNMLSLPTNTGAFRFIVVIKGDSDAPRSAIPMMGHTEAGVRCQGHPWILSGCQVCPEMSLRGRALRARAHLGGHPGSHPGDPEVSLPQPWPRTRTASFRISSLEGVLMSALVLGTRRVRYGRFTLQATWRLWRSKPALFSFQQSPVRHAARGMGRATSLRGLLLPPHPCRTGRQLRTPRRCASALSLQLPWPRLAFQKHSASVSFR